MLEEEEKVNNKTNESENIYPKSIKSKMIIKLRLRQILREMNKEYPLSEFGEDIDIGQYRQSAESVFYSIFFILIENFRDAGTSLFLNKILSTLPINEIEQGKNSNDPFLPIKIDVILYVLSSIMEVLEVENSQSSINIIHN